MKKEIGVRMRPQSYKIIVESFNNKRQNLVIENLSASDAAQYYDAFRALSESYDMNVEFDNRSVIVTVDNYSRKSLVEGVNKFLEMHKYDDAFLKGSKTKIYVESDDSTEQPKDLTAKEAADLWLNPDDGDLSAVAFKNENTNIAGSENGVAITTKDDKLKNELSSQGFKPLANKNDVAKYAMNDINPEKAKQLKFILNTYIKNNTDKKTKPEPSQGKEGKQLAAINQQQENKPGKNLTSSDKPQKEPLILNDPNEKGGDVVRRNPTAIFALQLKNGYDFRVFAGTLDAATKVNSFFKKHGFDPSIETNNNVYVLSVHTSTENDSPERFNAALEDIDKNSNLTVTTGSNAGNHTTASATDAPASESPASETPTSESPTSESPASETPTSESPTSESPASESPASETPTSETPTSESPTSESPTSESPTSESPASESPASESPTSESPTSETPTSESPASEDPAVPHVDEHAEEKPEHPVDPAVEAFLSKFPRINGVITTSSIEDESKDKVKEQLAKLYNSNAEWKKHIDKYGSEAVSIKKFIFKPILDHLNIQAPKTDDNGNEIDDSNDSIEDMRATGYKLIKDFNKTPPSFAEDHAVIQQFGFPMLNFGSRIVRELNSTSDPDDLKVLLKAFMKEIRPTDIADALIGKLSLKNKVLARLKDLMKKKGIPVTHKNLMIKDMDALKNAHGSKIDCTPIDERSSELESVNLSEFPLIEGPMSFLFGGKSGSAATFGSPIPLSYMYLKQYYEIIDPFKNEDAYLRYVTTDTVKGYDGKMPKDKAFAQYQKDAKKMPFLILQPRTSPKEGARITAKPLLRGKYFVKSCIKQGGKLNNMIGYFITEDEKNGLFAIG